MMAWFCHSHREQDDICILNRRSITDDSLWSPMKPPCWKPESMIFMARLCPLSLIASVVHILVMVCIGCSIVVCYLCCRLTFRKIAWVKLEKIDIFLMVNTWCCDMWYELRICHEFILNLSPHKQRGHDAHVFLPKNWLLFSGILFVCVMIIWALPFRCNMWLAERLELFYAENSSPTKNRQSWNNGILL